MLDDGALLLFQPLLLDVGPVGDRGEEALVLLRDARAQLFDCEAATAGAARQLLLGALELHGQQRALDLEGRGALQAARQPDVLTGAQISHLVGSHCHQRTPLR